MSVSFSEVSTSFMTLYGDSLSLPRKGAVQNDQRYITLIHRALQAKGESPVLLDRGEGASTISMMLQKIRHDRGYFSGHSFSIAVIQSGVVDCAPRPIKEETRALIGRLPNFLRRRIIKYLHNNRTRMLMRRFYVRTDLPKFEEEYQASVELLSETYKHVFCVNICPATAAYEAKAPGVSKQVDAYNRVIGKVVQAHDPQKIHLIDVHSMVAAQADIYDYILREDDHHITPLTHRWIADTVIRALNL